jgi:23S rRNA U2552 (ribose-2'-O)-methylase RlmE/FtsJ
MSIFLLPKILHCIQENDIVFKMTNRVPNVLLSQSLYQSLCETKIQIEKNDSGWDNYKKLTNPFEFIHTVVPGYKSQVSKLTPLSRSFYKMIEMSTIFDLCNNKNYNGNSSSSSTTNLPVLLSDYVHNISNNMFNDIKDVEWFTHDNYYYDVNYNNNNNSSSSSNSSNSSSNGNSFILKNKNPFQEINIERDAGCDMNDMNIMQVEKGHTSDTDYYHSDSDSDSNEEINKKFKSFHLAEGPGGFIEAVAHLRNNKNDTYYGMTLTSSDIKCPGWKKSKKFLEENSNVVIERGIDETGNLLSRVNFLHCCSKYKNSMDLVTGDGGIDFSEDFNNQEHTATKLIIAQIIYAISIQSNNGNFVLKVFDTFSNVMVDILYLLACLYKNVYIMKPQTSRYANSEKYIICKGFNLHENKSMIDTIIQKVYDNFENLNSNLYIESIFNFKCSRTFLSKIEEINIIIGKKQIENIMNTLNLIINKNSEKNDHYKKNHIQKCIKWCEKYNIPFHKNIKSMNIFLSSSTNFNSNSSLHSLALPRQ